MFYSQRNNIVSALARTWLIRPRVYLVTRTLRSAADFDVKNEAASNPRGKLFIKIDRVASSSEQLLSRDAVRAVTRLVRRRRRRVNN